MKLISTQEAQNILHTITFQLETETILFFDSSNRIAAEEIRADRPIPPYDQVRMDGIAITHQSFVKGRRQFKIQEIQAAGEPKKNMRCEVDCMEVMTGAILPVNTDTVIRYEDIIITDGIAEIQIEDITKGQNIELSGSQRSFNEILIPEGSVIGTPEIGVLASIGKTELAVYKWPKVSIVSTGNELVPVDEKPEEHQIRRSNCYTLASELQGMGIQAKILHIRDHKDTLLKAIGNAAGSNDVLIFSGGVSKGKFDYLPEVFEELDIKSLFHGIRQRPGKPFWFGKSDQVIVFAFPGNPVSSFLCFHRYFKPWLMTRYLPGKEIKRYARLTEDIEFSPPLSYFCLVKLSMSDQGIIEATPCAGKGSGDLAHLMEVNGFLELPPDRTLFTKGEIYPCFSFRSL